MQKTHLVLIICATLGLGRFVSAQPMVVGWGDDTYGQIDIPLGLTNVMAIAAGAYHSLALMSNGTVVAWGAGTTSTGLDDDFGQSLIPTGLTNVTAISAGGLYNVALKSNGTVLAWGYNNDGETNVPNGLTNVIAIAAGSSHSLALKSDGTVVAWGYNNFGQTNVPNGLTNVIAISAGGSHSLALKSNGTVVVWGHNYDGQTNVPNGLTNVIAIAGGFSHCLALKTDGTVVAWGGNYYGETSVPPGLTGVKAIAASVNGFHSLALQNNGTIVDWGKPYPYSDSPPLLRLDAMAVATGQDHALALAYDNDFFGDRLPISGTNIFFQGSNIGATGEPSEPPPPLGYYSDETNSVWFQWTAPATGGAVLVVNTDFNTPMVSVYTNNTLATLGRVAANSSSFNMARVAFTAVSNTTYNIAVEGSFLGSFINNGDFTGTLVETPPPANDSFASRSVISSVYFATAGSFLGASREPGEPAGNPVYPQTLWWTWTAPTNIGNSSIPVRLMASSVNWTPSIGVYTGSMVTALLPVSINTQTNGFANGQFSSTGTATFTSLPGVAYQISIAGYGGDPGGNVISPRFGSYQFSLNASGLSLTLTNLTATPNYDDSYDFSGTAVVVNSGPAMSHNLRIRAFSASGVSVLGPDHGYSTTNQTFCSTNDIGTLPAGQTISLTVSGTIPAAAAATYLGDGYGAYAQLEEAPFDGAWFAVDGVLIGFADWPNLNGNNGPGGGVVRLDPDFIGLSAFDPLLSVSILGPTNIFEGTSMTYTGKAVYADSTIYKFTNTAWAASKFTITTNGIFTAGAVASNTAVSFNAPYSSGGLLVNAVTNIVVLNLPPPILNGLKLLANGSFALTLNGVPGRNHVIEAATDLTPPVVWTSLTTNLTGANGLLNYTNSSTTNFPERFFRAREM